MSRFLFYPVPHQQADSINYWWVWHKTDDSGLATVSSESFEYLRDCLRDAARAGFDERNLSAGETVSMLIRQPPAEYGEPQESPATVD
jgi:hypothetical protein